jgi:putative membrane protein
MHDLTWSFEPWLIASLVMATVLYVLGLRHIRAKAGKGRVVAPWQVLSFAGGLAVLVAVLVSPFDAMAEELFSAHMAQHLALMLVATPLFVWSRPIIVWFYALPAPARRRTGRFWVGTRANRLARLLNHPLTIWVAFNGFFVFWHTPVPYTWALHTEWIHDLEHACFFFSAYAFWSVVIETSGRRRLDYGATIMFVAAAAVLSSLPGALMIVAQHPFYAVHAEGAARWGMTLIDDQHFGGLIMWIPGGFVYLAAICWLVVLWLRDAEERADAHARLVQSLPAIALALLLSPVLAGGGANAAQAAGQALGDPARGAKIIQAAGCGACHMIPGLADARGLVGPPLDHMARRIYIAGLLRNTPANMVRWLRDPQAVLPGNAMPSAGLSEAQARDIAAYLDSLR